jgi:hypothetical protein
MCNAIGDTRVVPFFPSTSGRGRAAAPIFPG